MKIVFLNDGAYLYASGHPSAEGGTERDIWLLARALAVIGWSATVGVCEGMKAGERLTIDGVEYTGIGQGRVLLAWHRFLSSERPDWMFWQGASHLWGPLVEIARLAGVRTIFSVALDSEVRPRHTLFLRRRWWLLYALGLLRSDRIFVQHGRQLFELSPQWRSKAYILPKVCILPSIAGETVAVKPHSERASYVAWIAVLRKVKRADVLIEIARKAPAIRFVVCGGPSTFMSPPGYGEWVVDALRAQPNIEFLGKVPHDKVLEIIANASMLLSTSDEEGFPSVFLEAWSAGTPVVSLKIDPDGVIDRERLGTVPGTVENATADISALMDSPQQREEIAVRARRYIARAHSEAAVAAVFERAIRDVCS